MQCIWEGRLDSLLDTIKLYRILDTVLFWARRHFRPWVVRQVDACRLRLELEKTEDSNQRATSSSTSTPCNATALVAHEIEGSLSKPNTSSLNTVTGAKDSHSSGPNTDPVLKPKDADYVSRPHAGISNSLRRANGSPLSKENTDSLSSPELAKSPSTSDTFSMKTAADTQGNIVGEDSTSTISRPKITNQTPKSAPEKRSKNQNKDRNQNNGISSDAASQSLTSIGSRISTPPAAASENTRNSSNSNVFAENLRRSREHGSPVSLAKKRIPRVRLPPPPAEAAADSPTSPILLVNNDPPPILSDTRFDPQVTAEAAIASFESLRASSSPTSLKEDSGQTSKQDVPSSKIFDPKKYDDFKWDLAGTDKKIEGNQENSSEDILGFDRTFAKSLNLNDEVAFPSWPGEDKNPYEKGIQTHTAPSMDPSTASSVDDNAERNLQSTSESTSKPEKPDIFSSDFPLSREKEPSNGQSQRSFGFSLNRKTQPTLYSHCPPPPNFFQRKPWTGFSEPQTEGESIFGSPSDNKKEPSAFFDSHPFPKFLQRKPSTGSFQPPHEQESLFRSRLDNKNEPSVSSDSHPFAEFLQEKPLAGSFHRQPERESQTPPERESPFGSPFDNKNEPRSSSHSPPLLNFQQEQSSPNSGAAENGASRDPNKRN